MSGRTQTVTRHGNPDWCTPWEVPREDCPECASSDTILYETEKHADEEKRFFECCECGCRWRSTPEPSAEASPSS